MDADKEGFLRDIRSLIQTIGRAARNENGKVLMYADRMTGSMAKAIDETNRRRAIQMEYNADNGITPKTIFKSREAIMEQTSIADSKATTKMYYNEPNQLSLAADPIVGYMTKPQLEKLIEETQRKMERAAKDLDFLEAARFRDEIGQLREKIKSTANT
jgi:excinuclease ABC subunit B